MANEIALNKDFKEKLFEKIQSDIGSLLGEEEMKAITRTAFERMFFQERREQRTYGNDIIHPPLIQELVESALRSTCEKVICELVKEREAEIMTMVDDLIKGGSSKLFMQALDSIFATSMEQYKINIMSDVMNR